LSLYKNTKNLKSLLTNLLHRRPLETTSRAAGWATLAYDNSYSTLEKQKMQSIDNLLLLCHLRIRKHTKMADPRFI